MSIYILAVVSPRSESMVPRVLYCVVLFGSKFEKTEISHTIFHVNKIPGYNIVDGIAKRYFHNIHTSDKAPNKSWGTIYTADTVATRSN